MEITYFGGECFRLKGKKAILLFAPEDKHGKKELPQTSADIVAFPSYKTKKSEQLKVKGTTRRKQPFIITEPGEYEIEGIFVFGYYFSAGKKGNGRQKAGQIFIVSFDGLRLVHLGKLSQKLSDKDLEKVNGADILFVPVGGGGSLTARQAVEVVNQINPKLVIPMLYQETAGDSSLAPVADFLKEMAVEVKPLPSLVISKEKLPDETEVALLKLKT